MEDFLESEGLLETESPRALAVHRMDWSDTREGDLKPVTPTLRSPTLRVSFQKVREPLRPWEVQGSWAHTHHRQWDCQAPQTIEIESVEQGLATAPRLSSPPARKSTGSASRIIGYSCGQTGHMKQMPFFGKWICPGLDNRNPHTEKDSLLS